MIRVTQQDSAKDAKRYYATADYYSEGQELVGSWGGKGAARLGLEGTVDKFSFDRLCDNLDPRTGEPLTVRTRTERTVGYDFTFSVPKSVSLLYAMSGDQGMLDAFRSAVDETMREMEEEMQTRVRKGRQDDNRTTGNMTWAEFIHTTSRPVDGLPDPQLHAHVFVFNTTWDEEEERWKAGQFRELKRDAPYFQAAFRVRLTVQGFTRRGDIIVDHGWVIDRDFGHLSHGYVVTSHASQGVTVDKVFVGISSESFPATYQRTAYVALTRGREQAQVFTDDLNDLLKAVSRPDDPLSATELSELPQQNPTLPIWPMKRLGFNGGFPVFDGRQNSMQPGISSGSLNDSGLNHAG